MFHDNMSHATGPNYAANNPLSGLAGILKTKEVMHFYNAGESFGSGKYGIIKLVQKKNYDKI